MAYLLQKKEKGMVQSNVSGKMLDKLLVNVNAISRDERRMLEIAYGSNLANSILAYVEANGQHIKSITIIKNEH
jgi:hypothetical protein